MLERYDTIISLVKCPLISSLKWIATSTSLYLAHALAVNVSESGSLARLLDHFVSLKEQASAPSVHLNKRFSS